MAQHSPAIIPNHHTDSNLNNIDNNNIQAVNAHETTPQRQQQQQQQQSESYFLTQNHHSNPANEGVERCSEDLEFYDPNNSHNHNIHNALNNNNTTNTNTNINNNETVIVGGLSSHEARELSSLTYCLDWYPSFKLSLTNSN